jgi:hypothetical protein
MIRSDPKNAGTSVARSVLSCALITLAFLSAAPAHASCWIESVAARKLDGVEVVGVRFIKMRNQTLFLELAGVRYFVDAGTVSKEGKRVTQFERAKAIEIGEELLVHDGDVYKVSGGYHDSCTIRGIITPDKRGVQVESQSSSPGLPPTNSAEFVNAR